MIGKIKQSPFMWLVFLLSWAMTTHGIWSIVAGEMWVRLAVAGLGGLLLHFTILTVWKNSGETLGNRCLLLGISLSALGICLSLISASFASSIIVELWNSKFLDRQQAVENQAVVLAPVIEVAKFTRELSQQLDGYANLSGERAHLEETKGTSCEGPPKPPICGSICNLRNAQRQDASAQSAAARSLNQKAISLQAKSASAASQQEMNSLFIDMNKVISDPALASIRSWATKEEDGFKNGFLSPDGKVLQCSDPQALKLISSIKSTADRGFEAPDAPPIVTEQDVSDAARRNFDAITNVALAALGGPAQLSAALQLPAVSPYKGPWIIAIFVELCFAALAAGLGWSKRGFFGDPVGRRLDPVTKKLHQEILFAISYLSFHDFDGGNPHTYLLVPNGATKLRFNVERLPYYLKLNQPVMRSVISLDDITDDETKRARIKTVSGDVEQFSLWEFPNHDAVVRKFTRQLGLANDGRTDPMETPPAAPGAKLRLIN